jgi:hypothetical protein
MRMWLDYIGRLIELGGHVLSEQVMETALTEETEEGGSLRRQDSNFLLSRQKNSFSLFPIYSGPLKVIFFHNSMSVLQI